MDTLDAQIGTLEAKGLIRIASQRPELEYLFRHWLVQDAAYGSLLKQERRELHRLVGEALESLYPDRRRELAGILAMHFEQAGDATRAIDYLLMDGRYALERNAIREAYAAFQRAAVLLGPPGAEAADEERRLWIEIQLQRARSSWSFRPAGEISADLEELLPSVERSGDPELIAQTHLYLTLVRIEGGASGTDPAVRRSQSRLEQLSSELDDPSLAALPLALVGMNKIFTGPIREGVDALTSAIPMMERRRDFIGAAFARGWLAIGLAQLGEFEAADEASRRASELAANGDLIAQLDAQITEAMVRSAHGDLDEAAPLAQACVRRSQDTGATACAVVSAWILGDVYQRQGRFGEAGEVLRLGLDISPGSEPGMWGPTLQAWWRANEVILGEDPGGEEGWDEALAIAKRTGNHLGAAAIRWKRAEVRLRQGHAEGALADLATSAAILEEQGARPNLARVLRGWGQALRSVGRSEEADARLRDALGLFEAMGIEREAREVREELAG